jgi:phosphatidylinositol alpha 1,6-mannosyltransferase
MEKLPRVALFAETFHETNGAANVLRRLTAYAKERDYPFLCVRAGDETRVLTEGNLKILELARSSLSIKLDTELKYDPFLWRYKNLVRRTLESFQPDVLHLTGFSDVSQLGFYFAHFQRIPAVASWHTNGHEYAARRALSKLNWLPNKLQRKVGNVIEKVVLRGSMKMYFLAQVQLAPNQELVRQMRRMTRRPSFLMSRGVDAEFLSPSKRQRTNDIFTIGYVGRLQAEKNVRFLARIEAAINEAGLTNYKFLIVGDGSEEKWLQKNLRRAEFTGVLRGEELARAFAGMDLFAFPSKTDAFGNVVLEAMAAGVPGVVMPEGGPKFLIEHGKNGFVARDEQDFCEIVKNAVVAPESLTEMKTAAREAALTRSWEKVFEGVFEKYRFAATLKKNVRVGENNQILNKKKTQKK